MSVRKLFWIDPYLTECDAKITSVEANRITLDQTVAYAFEGGQQSDSGTIAGIEILAAERQEKEIFYVLPPEHALKVGEQVKVSIDWEKRYKIMRLHFAAELVLELVYQNFNFPEKVGANITCEKARVDFMWAGNISDTFPFLEKELKRIIGDDLEITSAFSDEKKELRYWEIRGFARVPCGGTHIRRTGELGEVKLKRSNPGKGKERIEISLA